jgi:hypothetical protein
MAYETCKKSCNECPFTKTSLAGWLADYTPQDLHTLVMSERPFPCHMTHKEDMLSWEDAGTEKYPLCMGALKYMKKAGKLPRNKDLMDAMKDISRDDLDNILSLREFFEHHKVANK